MDEKQALHQNYGVLRRILDGVRYEPDRLDDYAHDAHTIYVEIAETVRLNSQKLQDAGWNWRNLNNFVKASRRVADRGSTYRDKLRRHQEAERRGRSASVALEQPRSRYIEALGAFVEQLSIGLQSIR